MVKNPLKITIPFDVFKKNSIIYLFFQVAKFRHQKKEKVKKKTPIITHNEQIIRNI
jgi:hypothetical protein